MEFVQNWKWTFRAGWTGNSYSKRAPQWAVANHAQVRQKAWTVPSWSNVCADDDPDTWSIITRDVASQFNRSKAIISRAKRFDRYLGISRCWSEAIIQLTLQHMLLLCMPMPVLHLYSLYSPYHLKVMQMAADKTPKKLWLDRTRSNQVGVVSRERVKHH